MNKKTYLPSKQESYSTEGSEFRFVNLSNEIIDLINLKIKCFWNETLKPEDEMDINPKDIILNVKSIFKNEDIKLGNNFWMHNCASSLRELMKNEFFDQYEKKIESAPKRIDSQKLRELSNTLQKYKNFFNALAHFGKNYLQKAKIALKTQNIEIKDIYEKEFDILCHGLILNLYKYLIFQK